MPGPRLTIYLKNAVADQLEFACTKPGTSKSSLVNAALEQFLKRERDEIGDAGLMRRFDRSAKQFAKFELGQLVLLETLTLYIRYFLSVTPSLPKSEQESLRLLGNQRFEAFLAQIGKRLAGSTSALDDVMGRVISNDPDFLSRGFDEPKSAKPRHAAKGQSSAPSHTSTASSQTDVGIGAVLGQSAETLNEQS